MNLLTDKNDTSMKVTVLKYMKNLEISICELIPDSYSYMQYCTAAKKKKKWEENRRYFSM